MDALTFAVILAHEPMALLSCPADVSRKVRVYHAKCLHDALGQAPTVSMPLWQRIDRGRCEYTLCPAVEVAHWTP